MADKSFFNLSEPLTLQELADIGACELRNSGKNTGTINGVATLEQAGENNITFLSNAKYAAALTTSKAAACILSEKHVSKAPDGMALLISDNPYAAYAKIAAAFHPDDVIVPGISTAAHIDPSVNVANGCQISPSVTIEAGAEIGEGTYLAPGVYIGRGVRVGKNCRILHNVTLTHCIIGNNALFHPGVRIGQDGFGFATIRGVHIKIPQLGRVIIEDHVEIGANTCIDRGAGPDTIIGAGTKIDNLVQIGHNVQTGKGCIIVAHAGIAGSTKLGDYVVIGGQVGVAGHLNIGSMVSVAAQSGVMHDVPDKAILGGSPAIPIKQWHRQTIAIKKLTERKGEANE